MKLIFICTLLLFTSDSFALGRVVSYEEVKADLFASIQSIDTCGTWNVNGALGEFRLLKLYYAGQDMLFVDIVTLNNSGSQLAVLHGFSFSEINNDHGEVGILTLVCKATQENKISIEATAVNGHNDQKYHFSLIIDGIGLTYQYQETRTELIK